MNDKKSIEKPATGADQTRRRLTKAALTIPIASSLAPRAAFGCSVSGFLSGNVSENHSPYSCEGYGCTPGFWKTHIESWPLGMNPGECLTRNSGTGNCKTWDPTFFPGGATRLSYIAPDLCSSSFSTFISNYGYNDNSSLMEVLLKEVSGGGNTNSILAHYIAALLNSMSSPISYGASVEDIKKAFCKALAGGDMELEKFKNILDVLNNRGCFLNSHGSCEDGFVLYGGACIPAAICTQTDPVSGECTSIDPITP